MNDVLGTWEVDQGIATIERDPYRPGSLLLNLNGTHSSYIDPDPLNVEFEYMQWMVGVIEQLWEDPDRLALLHLGGAACTMARWAVARYKNAHNLVIESDAKLADLVRKELDLPRAPKLRIRVADAATELANIKPGTRDIIIRDIFDDGATPEEFCTVEYAQTAKEVLSPDGVYLVNCGDRPNLLHGRSEAATLRSVFEHVYAVADGAMFKGRRIGNIVYVCTARELDTHALRRTLLVQAANIQVMDLSQVQKFAAGSQPLKLSQLDLK